MVLNPFLSFLLLVLLKSCIGKGGGGGSLVIYLGFLYVPCGITLFAALPQTEPSHAPQELLVCRPHIAWCPLCAAHCVLYGAHHMLHGAH